jgi:tetratricopeptide (TPR) repeat protein
MKKLFFVHCILISLYFSANAQNEGKHIRQGNSAYEKGNYESAAEAYRKGVEQNAYSYEANFNLGDALYQQGEYEPAARQFDLLRQPGMDKKKLADVYHNLGNSMMEQQKYQEAANAYKEALRNNPNDADTRYNLVYALEKLKQQQQQQQENQDQQQDQKDQQDQENQDQQNQDQQDQEQQNQENQDQQQQEQQEGQEEQQENQKRQQGEENQQQQGEQQPQGKPKDEISRAEAERILQALQMDENKLHEDQKKKKVQGQRVKILKEW